MSLIDLEQELPIWTPNVSQNPDESVVAFDKLVVLTNRLKTLCNSVIAETKSNNNYAAEHGIDDGVVGIADTFGFVPRPLRMIISSSDMHTQGFNFHYIEQTDIRSLLIPDSALAYILEAIYSSGLRGQRLSCYNHLAGTQHINLDGSPDILKNNYLSHLHRFTVGTLVDGSYGIFFLDPEYALPSKQEYYGVKITRPSVTNILGVNITLDGDVISFYSGRFDTSRLTKRQLKSQHGRNLTSWCLHKVRPDLYMKAIEFDALDVNMEELYLEEVFGSQDMTSIRSKFTPPAIMRRLIDGRSPGPEVIQQLSSTYLVLDGALYLMVNEDNDPKIKWKPI